MNESGHGGAALPPEIRGWNWGAFLLSWVWGIANATPIALLTLVPCVGLVMPFVLGAKGNEWAWQNRRWHGVDDFERAQKRWAIAGAIVWAVGLVSTALLVVGAMSLMKSGEAYQLAEARLRHSPEIARVFGEPLETGMVMGSVSTSGPSGEAKISFSLDGPKAHGTAYANARKDKGEWIVEELEVQVDGQSDRIQLMP